MKVNSKVMAALSSIKDHATTTTTTTTSGRSLLSTIDLALLRSTNSSSNNSPLDDKYIREILFVTSNSPISTTFLTRRISSRLESTRDPLVALKTLLLLHRLIRGGDRYFEQDLRNLWQSNDLRIEISWISTKRNPPLCNFIWNYSKFLEERMEWLINQAGKLEPIIAQPLYHEEKSMEVVLQRLSKCQGFLDRIMNCSLPPQPGAAAYDQLMQSTMNVVLKESFRVYESCVEGVEVVLMSSFLCLKNHTRVLALDVLKKASTQTRSLHEFYEKCKRFVSCKSLDYPKIRVLTKDDVSSLVDPFSKGLETKISTVWVEFEERDSSQSSSKFPFVRREFKNIEGQEEDVMTI